MQSLETVDSLPKYHENLWISYFGSLCLFSFSHLNIYLKERKLGQKHIEEAWLVGDPVFCHRFSA